MEKCFECFVLYRGKVQAISDKVWELLTLTMSGYVAL